MIHFGDVQARRKKDEEVVAMCESNGKRSALLADLVETLTVLQDAVKANDQDTASAAVTVFLMQYVEAFGHDARAFRAAFPLLDELRMDIAAKRFDDASPTIMAFLAKVRSAGGLITV